MPKVEVLTVQQGKAEMEKIQERSMHKWGNMFAGLDKAGGAVKISDLTRGAAWGLKRQALAKGYDAKITDKGTTLVITVKPKVPARV